MPLRILLTLNLYLITQRGTQDFIKNLQFDRVNVKGRINHQVLSYVDRYSIFFRPTTLLHCTFECFQIKEHETLFHIPFCID